MQSDQERLVQLIASKFGERFNGVNFDDDIFQKLGINSLQALDLLSAVEVEFDVTIDDSELRNIHTLQNLLDIIHH